MSAIRCCNLQLTLDVIERTVLALETLTRPKPGLCTSMVTSDEIDDIAETHGWGSDEEREAALAETAARQKRIDYEAAVALARQQKAEREQGAEQQERDRRAAERAEDNEAESQNGKENVQHQQQGWVDWISGEIKRATEGARTVARGHRRRDGRICQSTEGSDCR